MPRLAAEAAGLLSEYKAGCGKWGFDHASWAVLKHMYPEADIPVVEMSIDINKQPSHHFALGKALKPLREKGVLVIGSGNIVHNLGMIKYDEDAKPFQWAVEFDQL
jgi:4,5-DOPA dioxygenase extradiol